jgi:predicted regulator of Ras-like GTPase activity (Roadblock/LC7/MglB family)
MKRIIQNLKERVGVKGALIMTGGVVAASDLGGSLDADSVAALASASVLRAMKSAAELGLEHPTPDADSGIRPLRIRADR